MNLKSRLERIERMTKSGADCCDNPTFQPCTDAMRDEPGERCGERCANCGNRLTFQANAETVVIKPNADGEPLETL